MKRLGIFALTLATAAAFTATSVVETSPPVTDRALADASHAVAAKLRSFLTTHNLKAAHSSLITKMESVRESLNPTTAYGRAQAYMHAIIGTEKGRRMQDAATFAQDIFGVLEATFGSNPTVTSFSDMWPRLTAVLCSGTAPNAALVTAFTSELPSDLGDINPIFNQVLNCICAAEWDFTAQVYPTLFTEITALITTLTSDGNGPTNADIDSLIFAAAGAYPYMTGTTGTCSSTCQTALTQVFTLALNLAESQLTGLVYPPRAKARAPANFIACHCAGHFPFGNASSITTILGYFGTSPVTTISNGLNAVVSGDGNSATIESLILNGVDAFNFWLKTVDCSTTCKAATVDSVILGFGAYLNMPATLPPHFPW